MLVIFDCDGVLVDSEVLAAKTFSAELTSENISLSYQACYTNFKGHTLSYCLDWLERKYQKKLGDEFLARLEDCTRQAFSSSLKPVAGVEKVLQYLKNNSKSFCVASNGGHEKIRNSLRVTGLAKYFGRAIFSSEDVEQGKPAPDLFLHAAKVMGVAVEGCVVIEDSRTGVAAATTAGMQVMLYSPEGPTSAIKPRSSPRRGFESVEQFQSMQQLLEKLQGKV